MGIFDGVLGGQGGIAAQGRVGGVPTESMSDAYNDHLQMLYAEEELKRQHYMAQAQLNQMNVKQATLMGAYAKQAAIKPFNPNDSAAYTMPMSNLSTLWRVKYGDAWVETFDEDFWRDARARMSKAGMFEEAHGWFRIKEDV